MDLDGLAGLVETLRTRARTFAADLQKSEALTRSVLIDPVLRALGWATDDPAQVRVEFSLGGERADYCLLDADGRPRVLIEAKALNSPRSSIATSAVVTYAFQLLPRLNPDGRLLVGTTDGLRWEFYEVPHLKEPRLSLQSGWGLPGRGGPEARGGPLETASARDSRAGQRSILTIFTGSRPRAPGRSGRSGALRPARNWAPCEAAQGAPAPRRNFEDFGRLEGPAGRGGKLPGSHPEADPRALPGARWAQGLPALPCCNGRPPSKRAQVLRSGSARQRALARNSLQRPQYGLPVSVFAQIRR